LFDEPIDEVVCFEPSQLKSSLKALDALRRAGYYVAGCLSYEASYVLHGLSDTWGRTWFPLLHFFAFKQPKKLTEALLDAYLGEAKASVDRVELAMKEEAYAESFYTIKKHMKQGDTYQVNLTSKYKFELQGSSTGLYRMLRARQRVSYSALLNMPGYEVLSLSPELFFSKIKHKMHVKPMKGTMPRSSDVARDNSYQAFLKTDPKSRAENTMIVDLLRNDLSSISQPGSVHVSRLLDVESYETVHQMTSSIESDVSEDVAFATVIQHLFPCGSITGVPKRRTMELIRQLEYEPRHVYTGAIGYITPENNMCFNVPIRTLLCRGAQGELGVGGGIVYGSKLQDEFEELQLKAQFFTGLQG
jgi:para-aminobenzoate synthetase / 4-amino-4-deoxychorismate lyase